MAAATLSIARPGKLRDGRRNRSRVNAQAQNSLLIGLDNFEAESS